MAYLHSTLQYPLLDSKNRLTRSQTRCAQCHNLKEGEGNKIGPNLHGLFGRKTGSVDGFAYSDANKQKGIEWNNDTLVSKDLPQTYSDRRRD